MLTLPGQRRTGRPRRRQAEPSLTDVPDRLARNDPIAQDEETVTVGLDSDVAKRHEHLVLTITDVGPIQVSHPALVRQDDGQLAIDGRWPVLALQAFAVWPPTFLNPAPHDTV